MRLVENYLTQASQLLPKNLREDIVAELRASLEEQVLDHAAADNRLPNVADEKAVLTDFGHPMKIAGSYLPQQYLIGPLLFPAYLYALKIILIVVLAINLVMVLAVSGVVSDWNISFFGLFWHLLDTAITVVVIVTLVFVAIEFPEWLAALPLLLQTLIIPQAPLNAIGHREFEHLAEQEHLQQPRNYLVRL